MASESIAWFEFLLNPTLLESHLNQANPEPSSIDLIIQFIYSSIKRSDTGTNEVEPMDVAMPEYNKKKNALSVLALKSAAHLNWNLELLEQKLPLHMQDALLVALLQETLNEMSSPPTHGSLDTGPLLPYQLFSVSLYHRYALRALVKAKLPTKPIKVSNVPIPGQQDPTQESREVQEGILGVLDRGAEVSVRILEQLLGAGEVRAPSLATFTVHTHHTTEVTHAWDRCKLVPDEQIKCQLHCDLGAYHYLQERYEDANAHFAEAYKLLPELGTQPDFCQVNEGTVKGYYSSCASLCGRSTPLEQRPLYDRFLYSLSHGYQDLTKVLSDDNLAFDIPNYLRKNMELDLLASPEKAPQGLLLQVQTLNVIRNVLEGELWNSSYPSIISQAGKSGIQYMVLALVSKFPKYSKTQEERVRLFLMTLSVAASVGEVLVPAVRSSSVLAALFTQEELAAMSPKAELSHAASTLSSNSLPSTGSSTRNLNDIVWDLIHSYDPEVLREAVLRYKNTAPARPDVPKMDIPDLNVKWELPIPINNTLMKVPHTPQRDLVYLFISKAVELSQARSFPRALGLLEEASRDAAKLPGRETGRLCKLLSWMLLMTRIQHCLHQLPCVHSSVLAELATEARQCLGAHSGRDGVAPWTGVNHWCILLLLNAGDWGSLLGGMPLPSHLYILALVKPLAAAAQALQEKVSRESAWYELWGVVQGVVASGAQHKRGGGGPPTALDRHHEPVMSRSAFLDFLESLREPSCLGILVSLMGHTINLLTQEPSSEVHVDHPWVWPTTLAVSPPLDTVWDSLAWLLDHAMRLYPSGSHTSAALSTSWHLSRADLAFVREQHHNALSSYLTAVLVATDFLRNDNGTDQSVLTDGIIRRMIRCCMKLNCYTQAAILCQFLENIDYSTALRCLQERSSVDAMDAYYCCLWDVSLIEFIINMHQKRGELQRRDQAMKVMGLLEVNSNNNEEIQREAAKVRKHRFLRAMAKQYL